MSLSSEGSCAFAMAGVVEVIETASSMTTQTAKIRVREATVLLTLASKGSFFLRNPEHEITGIEFFYKRLEEGLRGCRNMSYGPNVWDNPGRFRVENLKFVCE
jgi:hypothetical protein